MMFGDEMPFAWGWAGAGEDTGKASEMGADEPRLVPHLRNFWAMFGPGGRARGPNMYGRGDLKFVLLDLLRERPKHGYEMIKDLENRMGGFYTPSAGAVYPTLQLMEDRGWVTSATVDGKKVYTITDAGTAALAERDAQPHDPRHGPVPGGERGHGPRHGHHGPRGPFGGHVTPDLEALGRESFEVARLMRDAVLRTGGDPAKLTELRKIVEGTRGALEGFLRGDDTPPTDAAPQPPPEVV